MSWFRTAIELVAFDFQFSNWLSVYFSLIAKTSGQKGEKSFLTWLKKCWESVVDRYINLFNFPSIENLLKSVKSFQNLLPSSFRCLESMWSLGKLEKFKYYYRRFLCIRKKIEVTYWPASVMSLIDSIV